MPLRDFSPLYGKKVLLLTHSACDVDSLGSAAAVHFSIKGKADTSIGVPERLNMAAAAFAKNLSIPYSLNPRLEGFDAVVCLDFSEAQMLGSMADAFSGFRGQKFLVDHHSAKGNGIAPAKNSVVDEGAVSATEVVHDLLKASRVKIPKSAYACIAAGIITDSASFMVADHETFAIMAEVMKRAGMKYGEITSLFSVEKDFSEKVACLKAAKRCRIFRSIDSVVAVSEVGAFEADAAASLVRVGADVAFCGYADKGVIRVSGRANNSWVRRGGFSLTRDVFEKLGGFFDGTGGGHAGAAGFNGKGSDVNAVLMKCAELVHEFNVRAAKLPVQMKEYTQDG